MLLLEMCAFCLTNECNLCVLLSFPRHPSTHHHRHHGFAFRLLGFPRASRRDSKPTISRRHRLLGRLFVLCTSAPPSSPQSACDKVCVCIVIHDLPFFFVTQPLSPPPSHPAVICWDMVMTTRITTTPMSVKCWCPGRTRRMPPSSSTTCSRNTTRRCGRTSEVSLYAGSQAAKSCGGCVFVT